MRRILIVSLALVAFTGCENTGAETDPLISNELVARGVRVTSLSTLVGAELALVASEPPTGSTSCPLVTNEGDEWAFDYGAAGCVPDSGLTEDLLVGTIQLTVAGGSGAFLGTLTEVGVEGSTLTASVSGNTSTAGSLLTADIDLGTATWARAQVSFTFDVFLELAGDADNVSLFVDSGELLGSDEIPLFIDVDEASTPRDELGGCFVPGAGSITLLRDLGVSDLDFTTETHSSGSVTATHNDRDPAAVSPCSG